MTFPRVRPPNGWSFASVINPSECEQIDTNLANAIDGRDGGAYAPTAAIVIGASGGNFVGLHVTSHAILDDFEGHVTNTHVLNVDGGSIICAPGSTVAVYGDTYIAENVTGSGTLHIGLGGLGNGHVIVNAGSDITLNGTMAVGQDASVTFTGATGHLALLNLRADSITTINGSAGHLAALTLGPFSNMEIDGTASVTGTVSVTTSGTFSVLGGGAMNLSGTLTQQSGGIIALADLAGPTTNPGGAGRLYATNVCKAWATVSTNGTGGVDIVDGYNVASVSISGSTMTIAFAHAFANLAYAIVGGVSSPSFRYTILWAPLSVSATQVQLADNDSGGTLDLAGTATQFSIVVFGRG